MSSVEVKRSDEAAPGVKPVDMKLEVVLIGVSDIDRAKEFYESLGWRFDGDFTDGGDFRVVQMTPHNSGASIIFGKGIKSAEPGLSDSLVLAVDDLDAAREDLPAAWTWARSSTTRAARSTSRGRTRVSAGATPKGALISRSPRSRTRTGTCGCYRRLRRGSPAASGSRRGPRTPRT
jgi:predicted enzyme related to lactoylglutathione lyase